VRADSTSDEDKSSPIEFSFKYFHFQIRHTRERVSLVFIVQLQISDIITVLPSCHRAIRNFKAGEERTEEPAQGGSR